MDHIGMDVHKKESQLCILTEAGELIERRVRSEPERFAAVLGERPRARILLEASTDSEWVARCLEGLGQLPTSPRCRHAPTLSIEPDGERPGLSQVRRVGERECFLGRRSSATA